MTRHMPAVVVAFLAVGWCTPGVAEVCKRCRVLDYIVSVGRCTSCKRTTSSGGFKLCDKCSEKQGKCQSCLAQLGPAKTPLGKKPATIRELRCRFRHGEREVPDGRLVGCTPEYADVTRLEVARGRFITGSDLKDRRNVCVLAAEVAKRLFPKDNPIGRAIHVEKGYYVVVGVMKQRGPTAAQDFSKDVYMPISTVRARIGDTIDIELTANDDGKTISVPLGKSVKISLEGNPTTGYLWKTDKITGEALRQVGEPAYVQKKPPGGRQTVGGGGTFAFTFLAVKPGKATVRLAYARPWEKNKPPIRSFTATVNVVAEAGEPKKRRK